MNLRKLGLGKFMIKTDDNKIESIEQLQFMNMPRLVELTLGKTFDKSGENNITNVSALNKCFWELRTIGLANYSSSHGVETMKGKISFHRSSKYFPFSLF